MNIVLLSGGSGKRLWPLSNEVRSKQFLKLFKHEEKYESMVQRIYRQIKSVDQEISVTIATSGNQVDSIKSHLGDEVNICVEPCRRDTFPAIALATAYLHDIHGVGEEDVVVICPVDPLVEQEYFIAMKKLAIEAEKGEANLVLLGIEPTCPSEKFGYIIAKKFDEVSIVEEFKEKPDIDLASQYIRQGALWNAGVFAFKLKYVLDIAKKIFGTSNYEELYNNYHSLEKISFDYAVVEHEKNIHVMRFSGKWKDLGTWNSLVESISEECVGNVICDKECQNTHIINELRVPVVAMGIQDVVIAASPDGILVSSKTSSDKLKAYVEEVQQRPMYEEKRWGTSEIIDYTSNYDRCVETRRIVLNEGRSIVCHKHNQRTEILVITQGKCRIIIGDEIRTASSGDFVCVNPNTWHSIEAISEVNYIEHQIFGAGYESENEHDIELQNL